MNSELLRLFFEGKLNAKCLFEDFENTITQTSAQCFEHSMIDLSEDYQVSIDNLILICDAVLSGDLKPEHLVVIGFGMLSSDHFIWDTSTPEGERIANTIYDWSCPQVNYDLNLETVRKFRHRLLTGESLFSKADIGSKICMPNLKSRKIKTC